MKHQKRKKSLDPIRRPKKAELPSLFQNFHFVEIKSKQEQKTFIRSEAVTMSRMI